MTAPFANLALVHKSGGKLELVNNLIHAQCLIEAVDFAAATQVMLRSNSIRLAVQSAFLQFRRRGADSVPVRVEASDNCFYIPADYGSIVRYEDAPNLDIRDWLDWQGHHNVYLAHYGSGYSLRMEANWGLNPNVAKKLNYAAMVSRLFAARRSAMIRSRIDFGALMVRVSRPFGRVSLPARLKILCRNVLTFSNTHRVARVGVVERCGGDSRICSSRMRLCANSPASRYAWFPFFRRTGT